MNTLEKDAGDKLNAIAQNICRGENVDYSHALALACQRNPDLAHRYNMGTVGSIKKYQLSPIEREMALLQSDPARVRFLAGAVIDHLAQAIAGRGERGQLNSETYGAALARIQREHRSLAGAAQRGFIAADDFWLLGVLVPAIAGEVERVHGIKATVL